MAYLKCPGCDQLAHVATSYTAVIHCPRCRALHQDVQLVPLDQAVRTAPAAGPTWLDSAEREQAARGRFARMPWRRGSSS
jgi:hypothetical protein